MHKYEAKLLALGSYSHINRQVNKLLKLVIKAEAWMNVVLSRQRPWCNLNFFQGRWEREYITKDTWTLPRRLVPMFQCRATKRAFQCETCKKRVRLEGGKVGSFGRKWWVQIIKLLTGMLGSLDFILWLLVTIQNMLNKGKAMSYLCLVWSVCVQSFWSGIG